MVNQGDTFTTLFYLDKDGYVLDGTETIKFSIKEKLEDVSPVLKLACGVEAGRYCSNAQAGLRCGQAQ